MQLEGNRFIAASPDRVWTAILDPEMLKACIPGCESMTGSIEDGYEAVVAQKVGPVSARFTGLVKLSDIAPGQAVTISGEGKGGAAGFAKGGAKVTLVAEDQGTRLAYEVVASVGGKLAQLGSRIIDGFARKLADQFFERFQTAIEGPKDPEPAGDAGGEDAPKTGWMGRLFGKKSDGQDNVAETSEGGKA
jgi:carbon monoxide dehydrogenase subunit G